MSVKALKGFKDILPDEVHVWQRIEAIARDVFHRYGFSEIKVPILEKTDLFVRAIGEATDIVEKEMYTFPDRNGVSLTMRPEGTAPLLRAFIEHSLHVEKPVQRLYTIGPMFRHERPQKGRLRQFHQLSAEVLGSNQPRLDAEVMAMAWQILKELGVSVSLEINSLGCLKCRPGFKQTLIGFLDNLKGRLCDDCERRSQTNPLRVLDCKSENCQAHYKTAPSIIDHLCGDCVAHFKTVKNSLELLAIPYRVNSFMVRGLDYYTRTTFELITNELGAQSAVGAGGRYDGLLKQLGGPDLPGIGFGVGLERLALLISQNGPVAVDNNPDIFLVALGDAAQELVFRMVAGLRSRGLRAGMDHEGRSLKSQMKMANRLKARYTLILGENELTAGSGPLKKMDTGEQEQLELPKDIEAWCDEVSKRLAG